VKNSSHICRSGPGDALVSLSEAAEQPPGTGWLGCGVTRSNGTRSRPRRYVPCRKNDPAQVPTYPSAHDTGAVLAKRTATRGQSETQGIHGQINERHVDRGGARIEARGAIGKVVLISSKARGRYVGLRATVASGAICANTLNVQVQLECLQLCRARCLRQRLQVDTRRRAEGLPKLDGKAA